MKIVEGTSKGSLRSFIWYPTMEGYEDNGRPRDNPERPNRGNPLKNMPDRTLFPLSTTRPTASKQKIPKIF
jgi:hypothetical protein